MLLAAVNEFTPFRNESVIKYLKLKLISNVYR